MKRLLWRASPARAVLEGWLAAGLVLLAIRPSLEEAPDLVVSMLFVLLSSAGGGLPALRMRPFDASWKRSLRNEFLVAGGMAAGLIVIPLVLLDLLGLPDLAQRSYTGAVACYFYLALSAPGFLGLRFAGAVYRRWDALRRRRFAWALTDAHLSVILWAGMLGLALSFVYLWLASPEDLAGLSTPLIISRLVVWMFTTLLLSILATIAALALFLPFSAAFSYWIARRMTRRLERLTQATSALQEGDLSRRVTVEGEDELALLQDHFNRMAENLQQSTTALQGERDKVAALLQNQRELTAAISHELRTPAAVILGYVEALRGRCPEDEPETTHVGALRRRSLPVLRPGLWRPGTFRGYNTVVGDIPGRRDAGLDHLHRPTHRRHPYAPTQTTPIPPAELRHDLDILAHEAGRLQAILNDLLAISQAETGRLSLALGPVDAGEALAQAVRTFAPLAWEQQKVQVSAEVAPNLPPILADRLRLEQALVNLLHNALRHTPPGGMVIASAAGGASTVRLEVADTGEGIPAEALPHIWEKFYQAGNGHSQAGAGLGLALVKELAEAMGANVGVESTPGEGSTFWIEFPA